MTPLLASTSAASTVAPFTVTVPSVTAMVRSSPSTVGTSPGSMSVDITSPATTW